MRICSKCGKQVADNAAFCVYCGNPMPKEEAASAPMGAQANPGAPKNLMLTTTDTLPGQDFRPITLVTGCAVVCKNFGKDIGASFRNLAGGEMKAYSEMMDESKNLAMSRMIAAAQALGADAVVGLRFATTSIVTGGAEMMAYGTAVKYC